LCYVVPKWDKQKLNKCIGIASRPLGQRWKEKHINKKKSNLIPNMYFDLQGQQSRYLINFDLFGEYFQISRHPTSLQTHISSCSSRLFTQISFLEDNFRGQKGHFQNSRE
jgi:hypothetical protein